MKCGTTICEAEAAVISNWPGQPTPMCLPCTRRAASIAGVMGFTLGVTPLPPADGGARALVAALEDFRG